MTRRWPWAYLALSLPAMLLVGDTLVAVARGWRVESRLEKLVIVAAVLWLAAVTAVALLPAGRRILGRYWGQLIALTVSLGLTWCLGELLVGATVSQVASPFHCHRPGLTMVHTPNPEIMRGVAPKATTRHNSWGVRGSEMPPRDQARRILCVGGSSTACTYLDDSKAWPQLLAADLAQDDPQHEYWVGDVGMPGYCSFDHLKFVDESRLIDEVDCVVLQAGVNDFMLCLRGPDPAPPLWTASPILQLLRTLWLRASTGNVYVEDSGGTVYTRRRALRAAAKIDDTPPDLDPCVQRFADNVERIIDVCRKHDVRIVVTTQPVLWRADLDEANKALCWFGVLPDGRYLSIDQLRAGMDRYNEALRHICDERHVELIDLSQLNGDPELFYDDCHLTEAGSERMAQLIAAGIGQQPWNAQAEAAQ